MDRIEIIVESEDTGKRIDSYLAEKLTDKSRSYINQLIEQNNIKLNGSTPKPSIKVKVNDRIEVIFPKPKSLDVIAEDIPVEILYEDNDLVVVNKPKGMVVHPAHGNYSGTLVNALLYSCDELSDINGVIRPGIVHRIDKDTSGVLVVAKSNKAHNGLSEQLKEHSVKREYYALVYGNVASEKGKIDAPIGRHKTDRKKMSVLNFGGKNATTRFEVIERFNGFSLIKAILETGRTHQIRVHMSYIGHPLVGDEVYGPKKNTSGVSGQMLHAALLGFVHPITGEYMEYKSDLPEYFVKHLEKLRDLS